MNNVFEVVDKTGRKILLTKERWKHITSPSSPHAYMTNHLEEVKQTLTNPNNIVNLPMPRAQGIIRRNQTA